MLKKMDNKNEFVGACKKVTNDKNDFYDEVKLFVNSLYWVFLICHSQLSLQFVWYSCSLSYEFWCKDSNKIYSHQTLTVVEKHVDSERLVLPYTSRSLTECFTFLNINLKSQHLWLLPILWKKRSTSLFSHLEPYEMSVYIHLFSLKRWVCVQTAY